jgi:RND superfamily putative drug exporter
MFDGLARLAYRWPKAVLTVTALLIAGAFIYGLDVLASLKTGGLTDPKSESSKATAALDEHFGDARPNFVLLVRADQQVDDPAVADEAGRLADRLATEPEVSSVVSYWEIKAPSLRSDDGQMALIAARITGNASEIEDAAERLAPLYEGEHGTVDVGIGGLAQVNNELNDTTREDILLAETIGVPLVALVLIIVLRGVFAALLPLVVGIASVIGTNAALKLISQFTDVSIFSLNLATGLSLGLAADYGLFIVKRFREEKRRGHDTETALRITMNTSGRTVLYSSFIVVVAMSAMLVFPLYFLRSFAFAGITVVLLAAAAAMVALPAAMVAIGRGLDMWDITKLFVWVGRLFRRRPAVAAAAAEPSPDGGWWRRTANVVMRRPVFFASATTLVLLLLGAPFLGLKIGLPDDRTLSSDAPAHVVQQTLRDDFSSVATNEVDVVVEGVNPAARATDIADYASRLSLVDGVVAVDSVAGRYVGGQGSPPDPLAQRFARPDATYLAVSTTVEGISAEGQELVKRIRDVPAAFETKVAGVSADLLDARNTLVDLLPVAGGIIVVTTLILLFMLTGSLLIPFTALLMNILSLSATFGVLVWIFQDYHFGDLLNFQQTSTVDVTLLVLLFCVAFGVSMDYEVFLLSRIKEEFARTRDNTMAVAFGIEKTGGIVTAAALITSIVFFAMVTAHVTNIKMFGMGLALAVLLDASLVRTLLVPALMRLSGKANWWAPRPMRVFYDRFGLKESDSPEPVTAFEPDHKPVGTRV